jgi:hypothetical protein
MGQHLHDLSRQERRFRFREFAGSTSRAQDRRLDLGGVEGHLTSIPLDDAQRQDGQRLGAALHRDPFIAQHIVL